MQTTSLKKYLKKIDEFISIKTLKVFNEKKSLISVLFHGLFKDENEIQLNYVHPQQSITIEKFKNFIEYFISKGYNFVSPFDILKGLDPNKNHVLITFDDGYFSNILAAPILNIYDVPATFFISSNHIVSSKCFWWDIIYRERIKKNIPIHKISFEINTQKSKKNIDIEKYIFKEFGRNAFSPIGDIDRPFSPLELQDFAKNKNVIIGNHALNHDILTNYSVEEVNQIINNSQLQLKSIIGEFPNIISYPNGNFSKDILSIIKNNSSIRLGITTNSRKNYLPFRNIETYFILDRFTLWGDKDIIHQMELFRSDFQISKILKSKIKTFL